MPVDGEIAGVPGIRADAAGGVRLEILGSLRVWRGSVEADPGQRQQVLLLAALLSRPGRLISIDELVEVIWGDAPPASATNSIHKYVGALRHLCEPWLPPREMGSLFHRRGGAYVCVAGRETLDLVDFRCRVKDAAAAQSAGQSEQALEEYLSAIALWSGAAGTGLSSRSATAWFASLNAEFTAACVAAADVALVLGRSERVLAALQAAAAMDPLHEPVQARLVAALGATGRQAESLAVYHGVRSRLADELGIDPGEALRTAYQDVLTSQGSAGPYPGKATLAGPSPRVAGLVGRVDEFAAAWTAVDSAADGNFGLVIIEGEPGIGKTRLMEAVEAEAGRRGVHVVWGRCHEGGGVPSLWPWMQITHATVEGFPEASKGRWLTGELRHLVSPPGPGPTSPVLPDTGARFRLFEQIRSAIAHASLGQPVLVLVDDLQWADDASLQMFAHLVSRAPARTAVIGAMRDRAPAPTGGLARMLTSVSRARTYRRVQLGPLTADEVSEIAEGETGFPLAASAAQNLHARTAGNPFFVRELARLLAETGDIGSSTAGRLGVPSTVTDVVRDRMDGLDPASRKLLQVAAVIGVDFGLGVLARADGIDEQHCLDHLEPLEHLGLVEPSPNDPRTYRFAHDVVRESVIEATPRRDVSLIHLRVADALEGGKGTDDVAMERVAHHLWSAGVLADPARTADALVCAGRTAAAKSALTTAERHLDSAAQVARTAGLPDLELSALSHLTAVVGMRSGYVGSALALLERAETLARKLGKEREATDLLFSRWAAHAQGMQMDHAGRLAGRLLERGEASTDPLVRAYGWCAWGMHQWGIGEVGAARRYLARGNATALDHHSAEQGLLRRDLQLLWPVMLALMTALQGDLAGARSLFDELEAAADDDPYAVQVWAAFSVFAAAMAGNTGWAGAAAQRGISMDPAFSFVFLGGYQRLARCWVAALTGDHPSDAADEAEQLIVTLFEDPARSGLATWYVLLAEMRLAAGQFAEAARALDSAERYLDLYGERYAEGLILLTRARVMHARKVPVILVRAAAERARALSVAREAHLFARRADMFLDELSGA